MPTPPPNAPAWANLVPLVAVALVILRNARARRLRIEAMWIAPVVIIALIALALGAEGMPAPLGLALDVAGLVIGTGLGWWRAQHHPSSAGDPLTHELTSRASPLGMLVILGVFAVRFGIRYLAQQNGTTLGVWAIAIPDALLVMSVGLVCAGRIEIFIRATRLLNEARAKAGWLLPPGAGGPQNRDLCQDLDEAVRPDRLGQMMVRARGPGRHDMARPGRRRSGRRSASAPPRARPRRDEWRGWRSGHPPWACGGPAVDTAFGLEPLRPRRIDPVSRR